MAPAPASRPSTLGRRLVRVVGPADSADAELPRATLDFVKAAR